MVVDWMQEVREREGTQRIPAFEDLKMNKKTTFQGKT